MKKAYDSDQILQLTSLLSLQEALDNEQYEKCQDLIAQAKEAGVDDQEIVEFLVNYKSNQINVRGFTFNAQNQQSRVRS